MVFKALVGGADGDLGNSTDFYGYFDDTVLIIDSFSYGIATCEGNDTIDASRPSAIGFHTVYAGSGNDTYLGGAGQDAFFDGSGDDLGNLAGGDDYYHGSSGDDKINGGSGKDKLSFVFQTIDFFGTFPYNFSGIRIDLNKTTAQSNGQFGSDILIGFEDIDGSSGNDTFFGTAGSNTMWGSDGDDIIDGRGGDDDLTGGTGKDLITGGRGVDRMELNDFNVEVTNVPARDIVIYKSIADSGIADGMYDTIRSFDAGTTATDDRISLKAIDANAAKIGDQAFIFRGNGGFSSSAGEVRLEVIGTDVKVHVDTDADAADEMVIFVYNAVLTAADFIL